MSENIWKIFFEFKQDHSCPDLKILILLTAKDAPAEIYVPIEIRNVTIVESKVIYLLFVPSLAPILGYCSISNRIHTWKYRFCLPQKSAKDLKILLNFKKKNCFRILSQFQFQKTFRKYFSSSKRIILVQTWNTDFAYSKRTQKSAKRCKRPLNINEFQKIKLFRNPWAISISENIRKIFFELKQTVQTWKYRFCLPQKNAKERKEAQKTPKY